MRQTIYAKNLTLSFGEKTVFQGLNMQFQGGQLALIKGPNGVGKSCLLQCICGIIPQHLFGTITGEISLYQDEELIQTEHHRAQHFSYLMQEPDKQICFPFIAEELFFAAENMGREFRLLAEDYAQLVADFPFIQNPETETQGLSFGQKKMLLLAGMILKNSDVYLLDEPCAGLSEMYREKVRSWVIKLLQLGKIVIIAEHEEFWEEMEIKELRIKN